MSEADQQLRRSAGTWVKLLSVWAIGLVVWAIYIVAIVYAILKWLGPAPH